jgi:PIN domain
MRRIVLFPDTNIFLQCKALKELPWGDVIDTDEIDLLVGAPVLDEIDRLKNDGNQRRARRARDTNSLFRQVLDSGNESVTIREAAPRIVLKFAPPLEPKRETPETLDLSRPDDRLIDEVMLFRRREPSAQIFSDDTGMMRRSRQHGVPLIAVPESWLLPPEKDDRDKQIGALKAEVAQLRNTEASLSLYLLTTDGSPVKNIAERMPLFADLSDTELTELMQSVQNLYPKATDFGVESPPRPNPSELSGLRALVEPLYSWHAPTQEQIHRYESGYEEWLQKARKKLTELALKLNSIGRIREFRVEVANIGTLPADEVLFEVTSHGGIQVSVGARDETPELMSTIHRFKREISFPPPPKAPRGEHLFELFRRNATLGAFGDHDFMGNAGLMSHLSGISKANFRRDRHAFYRREDDSKPSSSASFTCEELRHQREAQSFSIWIVAPFHLHDINAHLHLRVSARNMPAPVELHIPIEIRSEPESAYAVAANWRVQERGSGSEK